MGVILTYFITDIMPSVYEVSQRIVEAFINCFEPKVVSVVNLVLQMIKEGA